MDNRAAIVTTAATLGRLTGDALGNLKLQVQARELYVRDPAKDADALLQKGIAGKADAAAEAAADELGDVALCSPTQMSFTLPPAKNGGGGGSYHLRFRTLVDGKPIEVGQEGQKGWQKDGWQNPLDYQGGAFFSPQLKGAKARLQLPPPVVLGAEWEKRHVAPKWRWQKQLHLPEEHEGEPRLFTLAGLVPSVTGSRGASWVGGGLYGERVVELQYKEQQQPVFAVGRDEVQDLRAQWLDEHGWSKEQQLSYDTPATDVTTMLLALALNWAKAEGVPKLQVCTLEDPVLRILK